MTHAVEDRDGMRVLVVTDLGRRFHPDTGQEIPARRVDAALVHSTEIARYYGLPHASVFDHRGNMVEAGVWELVHQNTIGLRVNYNTEDKRADNKDVREWDRIKDQAGHVIDTKEKIVRHYGQSETDDGMYARYDDVIRYAKANGWTPGGGWPKKDQVVVQSAPLDPTMLAQIVAATTQAVMTALGKAPVVEPETDLYPAEPELPEPARKKREFTDEQRKAIGERLAAARAAKKANG